MLYRKKRIKKLSELYLFESKYDDLFPKDKWSDTNWENWVSTLDDNSLPDGAKKSDLLSSWEGASKALGVEKNMKGVKKFIEQVESGKYKYDVKEKEQDDKIRAAVQKKGPEDYDSQFTKDSGNAFDLDQARELGDSSKYLGKAMKMIALGIKYAFAGSLWEYLAPYIGGGDNTIPVHYQVLFAFVTFRDENLDIKYGPARRAMHEVAEYSWKKQGKPKGQFTIGYPDYHEVPGNKERKTYMYGMTIADKNRDNLYAQLSAAFGNCAAVRQKDGTYKVTDQYDFNVYRGTAARKGDVEARIKDFKQAIPTIARTYKAFNKFWTYLTGDRGAMNAAEYLEPLLLQIETQTDYKGVPTSISTLKTEERTGYEKFKKGVKGFFGRGEDETLIPGIDIPLLESEKNIKNIKQKKLTRSQLRKIIEESLKK